MKLCCHADTEYNQSHPKRHHQSINLSVNQSIRQLSLHLTDDTNALLHCMKWTSVSVCSSFILNHVRYVSGSMSETLIFNKNKSLCTNVSRFFLVVQSFVESRGKETPFTSLNLSCFTKAFPPKCHLQLWSHLAHFTLTSVGHEICSHCENSLSALLFSSNLAPSLACVEMIYDVLVLRLCSLARCPAAPTPAISANT